jgi:aspartate carbamoyltransferase regulatory subunit
MREMRVNAIKNGIVIDHLPTKTMFKIVQILKLHNSKEEILIASNLKSKALNKKGVIKLSNTQLDQNIIDAIALLAKNATISEINNYEVAKKYHLKTPVDISSLIKCFNPNCVTNHEKTLTRFSLVQEEPIKLICKYCERIITEAELAFL